MKHLWTNQIFLLIQGDKARTFALVQEATLDVCHLPMASRNAPQRVTKLLPKPVGSEHIIFTENSLHCHCLPQHPR